MNDMRNMDTTDKSAKTDKTVKRHGPSAFRTAFMIAFRSMPDCGSLPALLVQVAAAPAFTALFYLMLTEAAPRVGAAAGTAAASTAMATTLVPAIGACSAQASVAMASLLAEDRFTGVLPYMMLGSGSRIAPWAGRLCAGLGVSMASSCCALLVSLLATGALPAAGLWPSMLLLMAVSLVASLGVGLLTAVLSLMFDDALLLTNLIGYVLPLVGGVVAPASVFPAPVARTVHALPITWMTDAARPNRRASRHGLRLYGRGVGGRFGLGRLGAGVLAHVHGAEPQARHRDRTGHVRLTESGPGTAR